MAAPVMVVGASRGICIDGVTMSAGFGRCADAGRAEPVGLRGRM